MIANEEAPAADDDGVDTKVSGSREMGAAFFVHFDCLISAELRRIYDWAGAAECQCEYLRPARAAECVFLVFRFWRWQIINAKSTRCARNRWASGGTGWPPTVVGKRQGSRVTRLIRNRTVNRQSLGEFQGWWLFFKKNAFLTKDFKSKC